MRTLILIGLCAAGPLPALAGPPVSDAERERFLLEAKVVKEKSAPGGITGSYRATLRLGDFQHDAHVQPHDEYRNQIQLGSGMELDFRDSWRNNVAAYRIDRLLALGMVPVTVVRRDPRSPNLASFTWWVDDVLMEEKQRYQKKVRPPDVQAWNQQIYVTRLFDQLIYNFDRNLGNLLIDKAWNVWMIDHTRGFKVFKDLRNEKNLSETCEAELLAKLRSLDKPSLLAATKDLLSEAQVDGLVARRDRIVRIYDERIAARGADQVLYHLPPRMLAASASN